MTTAQYNAIKKLQRNVRIECALRKYFRSREYVEWWYHPDRRGGHHAKKELSDMFDEL